MVEAEKFSDHPRTNAVAYISVVFTAINCRSSSRPDD